jgi:hypothetical protein
MKYRLRIHNFKLKKIKKSSPCNRPCRPIASSSRIAHFLDSRVTDGGKLVSLNRRPRSITNIAGTRFC